MTKENLIDGNIGNVYVRVEPTKNSIEIARKLVDMLEMQIKSKIEEIRDE